MANRTVKDAQTIKGTNPQYLVEKIIRTRIYDCRYWKEECFALTAELLVDKAIQLRYIGGTHAGNIKPAPFLCLVLKMLQIQPSKDIVIEFIKNEEFKYVRALGAFYLRLIGNSLECFKYLEPLLNDYRKIRMQNREGKFVLSHMDEFVDDLLREERVCDVIMPRLQRRNVLEESGDIEPRVSILEDDLEAEDDEEDEEEEEEEGRIHSEEDEPKRPHERSSRRERSRERERKRDRDRRRSRSHEREKRRRSRSPRERRPRRERSRDRGDRKHRDRSRDRDQGGSKDSMSVDETNKIRASLGLAPLK